MHGSRRKPLHSVPRLDFNMICISGKMTNYYSFHCVWTHDKIVPASQMKC